MRSPYFSRKKFRKMRIGIALGSNLEDRLFHLRSARERLFTLHDSGAPFLCSRIYESDPVDCPEGSPPFLNAAIELSSSIPPLDFLIHLQSIERQLGRPANHPFHAPRTIDLDFLYSDNIILSHDTLTLPHKEINSRPFVLLPLSDICPERVIPNQFNSIRDMCDNILRIHNFPSCIVSYFSFD